MCNFVHYHYGCKCIISHRAHDCGNQCVPSGDYTVDKTDETCPCCEIQRRCESPYAAEDWEESDTIENRQEAIALQAAYDAVGKDDDSAKTAAMDWEPEQDMEESIALQASYDNGEKAPEFFEDELDDHDGLVTTRREGKIQRRPIGPKERKAIADGKYERPDVLPKYMSGALPVEDDESEEEKKSADEGEK